MASPSKERIKSFLQAAENGKLSRFKHLAGKLENGEGLTSMFNRVRDEQGKTALHYAAVGGKDRICEYVINVGKLDVNVTDSQGEIPLHLAILHENLPTTVYLIQNGANVLSRSLKGFTPLHCAAEKGNAQMLELLISHGAEINSLSEIGSPLQLAAANGGKEAVKVLLDHNADPNKVAYSFFTPLVSSIMYEYVECSEMLIKAGADPNLHSYGLMPLGYAASRGMPKMVKRLLEVGADPNAIDSSGMTPLECAAIRRDHESVRILFPVTSRVQYFPNWSVGGIMRHILTEEAELQIELKMKEVRQQSKSKGKEAFMNKDYIKAIFWYAEAKRVNPDDETLYSNISLCWAIMGEGNMALSEALACAKLRPNWSKAHYHIGAAWKILKNYSMAAESFCKALKLDPTNKEIETAYLEALKLNSAKN